MTLTASSYRFTAGAHRRVRWFSCGAASAVATKLDLEAHPGGVVAYCATGAEDADNERFLIDCERWFGVPVIRLHNPDFADTWSVWEKRRYMSGIAGAPCTSELKISPRLAFQEPGDVHVFGYTADGPDVKRAANTSRGGARWECRCDCGTDRVVASNNILSGISRSCGCLARELVADACRARRIVGEHQKREYEAWSRMKARCSDPSGKSWARYGGRGITVSSEWEHDFAAFYRDMGPSPSTLHSIDRIDNDGNYERGNCRWATRDVQNNNTSRNRIVIFEGESHTVSIWAKRIGIIPSLLCWRLNRWPIERAMTAPTRPMQPRGSGPKPRRRGG